MKYLTEYRDPVLAASYLDEIKQTVTRPWTIMEICGGQTHSLVKYGILQMLPDQITMVHGPGCPVCVTPTHLIDKAIFLALEKRVILCSFGDMLRVPGSEKSLLQAKAEGADVRTLYSPLDAVKLATQHPDRQVVFFAVGFETTAPANALSVIQAHQLGLQNYSIIASHVLVPPAMEALLSDPETVVQAFLAAGHVCTIMGNSEYYPIVDRYQVPIVVTGFEPIDLLQGILMVVRQLEDGEAKLENQYARVVREQGNQSAREVIAEVFEVSNRMWRGMETIPESGLEVKEKYALYDATRKFSVPHTDPKENETCIAGAIMKGLKKPLDCVNFGTSCTPTRPLGAPMVSSEGTCAAYYHFNPAAHEAESVLA
ncbi:hydrogenase formation protein HypD [Persicitalea sp.]|uniref:hydrogenase formation protein HypD n=1 Tax=Persicitalea sp. TaxID=3100273 RepID=UPI0035946123